ncbi:MAG: hypothetical protein ACFFCQ_14265 [Promethearchaeota archaeon]
MPFINLNVRDAIEALNSPIIIDTFLRKGLINPREADLLRALAHLSEGKKDSQDIIEQTCNKYFGKEAKRALDRLIKFATTDSKRVNWVLFSRTTQFIPYETRSCLEGYQPRERDILIIKSKEIYVPLK